MRKISTGEDSTLKTYRCMAVVLAGEGSLPVKFIDEKIAESTNGENEEVIADESQMLFLFTDLMRAEKEVRQVEKEINDVKKEMAHPFMIRRKFNNKINELIKTEEYLIPIPSGACVYFLVHIGNFIHNGTALARIENSKGKVIHNMNYVFGPDKYGEVMDMRQVFKDGKKSLLIEFEVLER